MNNDDNLDLLDLDNGSQLDTLPAAPVLGAPRPRKPWLLLGVGLTIIVLATYIIIRTIGDDSPATIEVDLDAPVAIVGEDNAPLIVGDVDGPTPGLPVRVVEDRKEVVFNPAQLARPVAPAPAAPVVRQAAPVAPVPVKEIAAPAKPVEVPTREVVVARQAAAPVKKAAAPVRKAAPAPQKKVAAKPVAAPAPKGSWYVQFGSYSTNALAQAAQRKIVSGHSNLFAGHQPVILAAVLPNGKTTYRLRVPFQTSKLANGFCQNAKSDGLDCYVAK